VSARSRRIAPLVVRQPARLLRPVGEIPQRDDAEHDRRHPLDQKQPLPPVEAGDAAQRQQRPRQRRAEYARRHAGGRKLRERLRPLGRGEPEGEIQHDAGKESGFRGAEQEPHGVEAARPRDEQHRDRDDPPQDRDPRDPDTGADAGQREVAGHLEQEIAEKENPGAGTEHLAGQPKRRIHLQRREADVDAIEVGDEVHRREERNQPAADARHRAAAGVGHPVELR
jgi:hypothetical protein